MSSASPDEAAVEFTADGSGTSPPSSHKYMVPVKRIKSVDMLPVWEKSRDEFKTETFFELWLSRSLRPY